MDDNKGLYVSGGGVGGKFQWKAQQALQHTFIHGNSDVTIYLLITVIEITDDSVMALFISPQRIFKTKQLFFIESYIVSSGI